MLCNDGLEDVIERLQMAIDTLLASRVQHVCMDVALKDALEGLIIIECALGID